MAVVCVCKVMEFPKTTFDCNDCADSAMRERSNSHPCHFSREHNTHQTSHWNDQSLHTPSSKPTPKTPPYFLYPQPSPYTCTLWPHLSPPNPHHPRYLILLEMTSVPTRTVTCVIFNDAHWMEIGSVADISGHLRVAIGVGMESTSTHCVQLAVQSEHEIRHV